MKESNSITQIAFIGIDGSGKTTISKFIEEIFLKNRKNARIYRAKGNNVELLREMALSDKGTETLLCYAFFLDLLDNMIKVQKSQDCICVWDRHIPCLHAYYTVLGVETFFFDNYIMNFEKPIYIYLEIDANTAVKRISSRGEPKELENFEFLSQVSKQYEALCSEYNMIKIDARKKLEEVKQEVIYKLRECGVNIEHENL